MAGEGPAVIANIPVHLLRRHMQWRSWGWSRWPISVALMQDIGSLRLCFVKTSGETRSIRLLGDCAFLVVVWMR